MSVSANGGHHVPATGHATGHSLYVFSTRFMRRGKNILEILRKNQYPADRCGKKNHRAAAASPSIKKRTRTKPAKKYKYPCILRKQIRSGCSFRIRRSPIITAVTLSPGIPNARTGISEPQIWHTRFEFFSDKQISMKKHTEEGESIIRYIIPQLRSVSGCRSKYIIKSDICKRQNSGAPQV